MYQILTMFLLLYERGFPNSLQKSAIAITNGKDIHSHNKITIVTGAMSICVQTLCSRGQADQGREGFYHSKLIVPG